MAPKTVPMKDLAINALNKLKTDKDLGKNGYSGIGRITKAAKTEKADVQAKKLSKAIKSLVESGDVVQDGKRFKLKSTKSSARRMKPYGKKAVPYATLPKLSTGGVEICIGNRFSPHRLDQESVQRISVSAVPPEYATADHEVLFEDGEGAEGEDEISNAKKKIKEGADLVEKSVEKLQSSKSTGRKVVIVHCYAGQNRSAAIISAYAIRKRGWTPKHIKDYLRRQVKKQRNVTAVLQNKAFRKILGM